MSDTTKTDMEIILDYMLDYGGTGSLPNMDAPDGDYEGGSGHHAYEAVLRLTGAYDESNYPEVCDDA